MREAKKYPINLTVKLVLNIEPGENGEYPSRFDVENAARLALIDGIERLDQNAMRGGLSEGIQDYLEDEGSDAAGPTVYKDYSEVTLHDDQPGGEEEASEDGPRYWQADWNDVQAEGVRNALSMGELVSIANEDEGIIAYALLGYEDRITDALNHKGQP